MSRLADSEERRRAVFFKVLELAAVMCFPTYVGIAVVAEPLTLTLLGDRWLDSAHVLVFFALSGIPFSLTMIHLSVIKSAAQTRALFWINLIQLCV
jgi:O-antigen/teichoic acid export membrane protein